MAMHNGGGIQSLPVQVQPGFDVTTRCPDCGGACWLTATASQPVATKVLPLAVNQAKVQGQMKLLFGVKMCMLCQRVERLEPDPTSGQWKLVKVSRGLEREWESAGV